MSVEAPQPSESKSTQGEGAPIDDQENTIPDQTTSLDRTTPTVEVTTPKRRFPWALLIGGVLMAGIIGLIIFFAIKNRRDMREMCSDIKNAAERALCIQQFQSPSRTYYGSRPRPLFSIF